MSSLAFLQPWFLLGLLAVGIPIAIHLLNRHRAVRIRFAAMEFLLRSQRKVARRLQIKQLLLLLLRCLLFFLVAMAFAKPFLRRSQGANPTKPRAIVVIMDDSMSMQARTSKDSSPLFGKAQKLADAFLKNLRGEDRVALLHGSSGELSPNREQKELTFDKAGIRRRLRRWKVTYRTTDLNYAIRRAGTLLRTIKGLQPEIVIFSDMAQHAFEQSKLKAVGLPPIKLFSIRPKGKVQNLSIFNVKITPEQLATTDAYRFSITIRNFGDKAVSDLAVTLFLNGQQRTRGFVSVAPRGVAQKSFVLRLNSAGVHRGEVRIGKDDLLADNSYFFALKARKRPRVLLVNGDPRQVSYLDELFYLERALRGVTSPFVLKTCSADSLCPDPQAFQVVLLANVGQRPGSWWKSLESFVKKGGGLFIAMGDQVTAAKYNRWLPSLLPRKLRHVSLAAQNPDGTGIALQRFFGELQGGHPIFRTLFRSGFNFQSGRISKLMLVEPRKAQQQGRVLWRFSHGPPALLERKVGKGRVLMLTTTLDRDWTDLPIRSFFLPWMQSSLTYLAGGGRFQQARSLGIAQKSTLTLKGNMPLRVNEPGKKYRLLRRGAQGYLFDGGEVPGLYSLSRRGVMLKKLPLVVNVDPSESDLTPLANQNLKNIGTVSSQTSSFLLRQSERLWPLLFLGLLLVFGLESLVMRFL